MKKLPHFINYILVTAQNVEEGRLAGWDFHTINTSSVLVLPLYSGVAP